MNTNESADLGTAQNNPPQTQKDTVPFEAKNFVDLVSKVLTDGSERSESPDSEEKDGDAVQATAENDGESEYAKPKSEIGKDDELDSEETEETKSDEETDRGLPKGVKKRIDKLSAKRREAEAEIERLKGEMERLTQEANKPARTSQDRNNPFNNLNSMDEVNREIEQAKQVRRWCEMNPDGAVVRDKNGNEVDYSAEEVRNIKIKALDALEEHLPKRINYLQSFNQFENIVSKEYPWWKDKSSQERIIADKFVQQFPEITKFPDYKMVLGDYIRGVKAREASLKKTSTQKESPPPQPKRTATPAYVSPKEAKAENSRNRFMQTGNAEHLSDIIANRFL